ncbi:hypothetical protein N9L68_00700 [bacterium]|nr:hypothetical protein [bacterium]
MDTGNHVLMRSFAPTWEQRRNSKVRQCAPSVEHGEYSELRLGCGLEESGRGHDESLTRGETLDERLEAGWRERLGEQGSSIS